MSSPAPLDLDQIKPLSEEARPGAHARFARKLSYALERASSNQTPHNHPLSLSLKRTRTATSNSSDRPIDELPPSPSDVIPVLSPSTDEEPDSIAAAKDQFDIENAAVISNEPGDQRRYIIPPSNKWQAYLMQEVAHNTFLEAQLIFLTFTTGILDSTTFTTYRVFVTKQTGNSIFLALYALGHSSIVGIEKNVAMSIGAFLLGAAFFGHTGHLVSQRRRSWLLISAFIQAALVSISAIIQYTVNHDTTGATALIVIALLSFAAGGQIALALCVKLPELNTTMITGTLIQLSTDRHIFKLKNLARNRRVIFYAALVAGAFVGAATTVKVGPQMSLLLAAICKVVAWVSFAFNHGMVVPVMSAEEERKEKKFAEGYATPLTKILWGD